jgi:hypothetical protein
MLSLDLFLYFPFVYIRGSHISVIHGPVMQQFIFWGPLPFLSHIVQYSSSLQIHAIIISTSKYIYLCSIKIEVTFWYCTFTIKNDAQEYMK